MKSARFLSIEAQRPNQGPQMSSKHLFKGLIRTVCPRQGLAAHSQNYELDTVAKQFNTEPKTYRAY